MAKNPKIGINVGIEGQKQFRDDITAINHNFKVLGSELKLVSSQFDKHERSVESLSAKNNVLDKSVEAQKKGIETLEAALKNATESFGENDKRTQEWVRQLNNAKAKLNETEREIANNEKAIKELGKSTDNSGEKFKKLGGILKGVGTAMGAVAVAAGAAAVKLGKEVVQQFGELEQNLGGSEAVFGKYAASIQKTGEEAYRNLGVSQSEYLATANKMGALFQGSGIEQQKSLELTEKAMQRAADVASVMGIDTQQALDSIAGAAKGNFTMMDNLGVAMNATTLEAYALSKGITTAYSNMSNTEKTELAMQMFFEKTEQYAGNFARESTETISGSLGLMQAALSSFTAGLGNADADMKNLTANVVESFQAVVKNIVPILENIASSLPEVVRSIIPAIKEILPILLSTVADLFEEVLSGLLNLLPELIPVAVKSLMTIVESLIENLHLITDGALQLVIALMEGIGSALPKLIPAAVEAITTIVKGLVDNLPLILNGALELILGLAKGLIDALPQLIRELPKIISGIVDFLKSSIPQIVETGITVLTALVDALPEIINAVTAVLPDIINAMVVVLIGMRLQLAEAGFKVLVAIISNLDKIIIEIVKAVPEIIDGIVKGFQKSMNSIIEIGGDIAKGIWDGIVGMAEWLKDKVKGFCNDFVGTVKGALGINSPSTVFRDEVGENIVTGVWEGIKSKEAWLKDNINKFFTDIISASKKAFNENNLTGKVFFENFAKALGFKKPLENAGADEFVAESFAENEKMLKKQAEFAEKVAKEAYANAKLFIEDYRQDEDYLITEEIKMWEKLLLKYSSVSKERVEIRKNIKQLKEKLTKEEEKLSKAQATLEEKLLKEKEKAQKAAHEAEENRLNERKKILDEITAAEAQYAKAVDDRAKAIYNSFGLFDEFKSSDDIYKAAYLEAENVVEKIKSELDELDKRRKGIDSESAKGLQLSLLYSKKKLELAKAEQNLADVEAGGKDYGEVITANLQSQVDELTDWGKNIKKLSQKGIDEGFVEELEGMGVAVNGEIRALLEMSDEELSDYVDLWRQKHELARKQATLELRQMRKETDDEVKGLISDLNGTLSESAFTVGKNWISGIIEGITSQLPSLKSTMDNISKSFDRNIFEGLKAGVNLSTPTAAAVGGQSGGITVNIYDANFADEKNMKNTVSYLKKELRKYDVSKGKKG